MLRLPCGGWFGDNTDYDGFAWLLGSDAAQLAGEKVLVLGSGGASQTVCAVLRDKGIVPRVISRAGPDNYRNLSRHRDAAAVVNTTPVGMYPNNGASPIDLRELPHCRLVLDLIYNPARTALLQQAQTLEIPCRNGLAMLVGQAFYTAERFSRTKLPVQKLTTALQALHDKTQSVTLIGMPGCGKSTVGALLAELTGRPFYDSDAEVVRTAGCSIPEIFARDGEKAFRAEETRALAAITKKTGCILAAGGGVVTVPDNLLLLHQNGPCVFLDCDLSRLSDEGRPVSRRDGIAALAQTRMPLYRAWSDAVFYNDDAAETAKKIQEAFSL
jgi:shikimate dehydrogenase